jgi:hypothetical protein
MIHEIRTYKLAPGGLAEYMEHAREVAPSRSGDFGRLLGFWHGEIGSANSVWNLWQHDSLDSREGLRSALQKNDVWRSTYLPRVQPLFRQGMVRVLQPVVAPTAPASSGNLYELRFLRSKPGRSHGLAEQLAQAAPTAAIASTVGIWISIAGHVNEVVHLSAFPDMAARLRVGLQSAEWREFLRANGPRIKHMDSHIVVPVSHSPMQ